MMVTLKELSDAKKFLRKMYAKDYPHYSPEQSEVSYELCTMSKTERSDSVEVMVMDMFERGGYNVDKRGQTNNKYDVWADNEKIEVKSSMAKKHHDEKGNVYYTYSFKGVKPECFDRLVLAYVSPNGIDFRVLTNRAVYARICNGELKRGEAGFSICHNKNSKIIGKDLYSFLGLTADKNKVQSTQRREKCLTGA